MKWVFECPLRSSIAECDGQKLNLPATNCFFVTEKTKQDSCLGTSVQTFSHLIDCPGQPVNKLSGVQNALWREVDHPFYRMAHASMSKTQEADG